MALLLSAAAGFFTAFFLMRPHEKAEKIPFDLHELLTTCRTLTAATAAEKGIILHFYAEPAISKIPLGDPARLCQVLVSLLSNAVKYTNTGMVKLHSAIKEMREKSVTMSFEVKDSGVGMTGEQIKKLLAAGKYGTKDIVKTMGGKLAIESTPGLGSKFSFDLTFKTINAPAADTVKDHIPDEFEMPMFGGEVLLCEDSALNQQIVCEHLARVGLKTVVADNGSIGVGMVQDRVQKKEKLFDLIFMDIHMPVMDGLEAASKILEMNTGIPIVAMTANIMSNDLEIYRTSGMYDFVGKPFTSQQLWRCLSKYFKPASRQTHMPGQQLPSRQLPAETRRIQVENELRKKIVVYFVKDNRNRFAEITDAINSGDIKQAHRLAHSLKGSAAQAGKILLQQAALEVEQNLKDEQNRVTPQQMAALEAELKVALAELVPLAEEYSLTEKRI
jgi:CheY-like chemotaxis protein